MQSPSYGVLIGWATPFVMGIAAGLLALAILTGGSQGLFQLYHEPDHYMALLKLRSANLRLELGLDSLFICAYTLFFAAWARVAVLQGGDRFLISLSFAMLLGTAFLDASENAHILALIRAGDFAYQPAGGELLIQQVLSQVKFHLAHLGMFLLALATPLKPKWGWVRLVFCMQLVAGVAIFIAPPELVKGLYLFRAAFFIFGPPMLYLALPKRLEMKS